MWKNSNFFFEKSLGSAIVSPKVPLFQYFKYKFEIRMKFESQKKGPRKMVPWKKSPDKKSQEKRSPEKWSPASLWTKFIAIIWLDKLLILFKAPNVYHSGGLHPLDPLWVQIMFGWLFNTKKNSEGRREGAFLCSGRWRGDDNLYPIGTFFKNEI